MGPFSGCEEYKTYTEGVKAGKAAAIKAIEEHIDSILKEINSDFYERQEEDDEAIDVVMDEGAKGALAMVAQFMKSMSDKDCDHEWTDISNEVIQSGKACFKCGKLGQ